MGNQTVSVIVLAGGIAEWSNTPKALLNVGSETLLERTVRVLQNVPTVARIAVVAPPQVLETLSSPVLKVPAQGSLWANTVAGIDALSPKPDDYLLLCAVDMPFLTANSVQVFLTEAISANADLSYAAVPLEALHHFLNTDKVHRTSATLREGVFTGGNVFLMRVKALPNVARLAQEAIRRRKNPLWLGQLAGWHLILRFLLRRLSVRDIEVRAEELLSCRCKAVIADLPELAFDVDKLEDYELAKSLLASRASIIG